MAKLHWKKWSGSSPQTWFKQLRQQSPNSFGQINLRFQQSRFQIQRSESPIQRSENPIQQSGSLIRQSWTRIWPRFRQKRLFLCSLGRKCSKTAHFTLPDTQNSRFNPPGKSSAYQSIAVHATFLPISPAFCLICPCSISKRSIVPSISQVSACTAVTA